MKKFLLTGVVCALAFSGLFAVSADEVNKNVANGHVLLFKHETNFENTHKQLQRSYRNLAKMFEVMKNSIDAVTDPATVTAFNHIYEYIRAKHEIDAKHYESMQEYHRFLKEQHKLQHDKLKGIKPVEKKKIVEED